MSIPRIALFGSGAWGANHLRVWSELGYLAAVCDSDERRLEAVRDQYPNLQTSTDPSQILDRSDIQGVVIATPAVTHFTLARQSLKAGKDVLVEKPLAMTLDEGESLVRQASESNQILAVGHVLEYHPCIVKLAELVSSGALGKVWYVYATRLNFGKIRTEESALWSFAPHDVASILRLLGKLPEEVACHGGAYLNEEVADVSLTHLRFRGGARGFIYVSWLHPYKEHRLSVVGDRQTAVFDDMAPWPEKLVCFEQKVDWLDRQVPVASSGIGTPVEVQPQEPLRRECEEFVEAIRTRRGPRADGSSGLAVLRVLDAAQRSLDRGGIPQAVQSRATFVHGTALVDSGAELGEGTRVWHFSHVMGSARVGRDCVLGQNVFVAGGVRIGDGVKIQNNVSVYEGVELEDRVFCGPSVVFTNVNNPRAEIERKDEFRATRVQEGATLGANATIVCGVNIGRYAFVAAGAVVTKDVPSHALMMGTPAQVVGWMCKCGVRLGDSLVCQACGSGFIEEADGGLTLVKSN